MANVPAPPADGHSLLHSPLKGLVGLRAFDPEEWEPLSRGFGLFATSISMKSHCGSPVADRSRR